MTMLLDHAVALSRFDPRWARIVEPVVEPLTVREVKDHLRVSQPQDDAMIAAYIRAARTAAEETLNRGLLTQTWQLTLRRFADVIYLPQAAPLQNDPLATPPTAVQIQYYDTGGVLQTLDPATYSVDTICRPARILRAPRIYYPWTQWDRIGPCVSITYVVGWTTPAAVPERIKQGMRLYIGWLDADRDGMEVAGANARAAADSCWSDRVEAIDPIEYGWREHSWRPWRLY